MSDEILNSLLNRIQRLEVMASSNNAPAWGDIDALSQKIKRIEDSVDLAIEKHNGFVKRYAEEQKAFLRAGDLRKSNLKMTEAIVEAVAESANEDRKELKRYADQSAAVIRSDVELAKSAVTATTEHGKAVLIEWANSLGAN